MKEPTSTPKTTGDESNASLPKAKRHFRPSLWPLYRRYLQHSSLPILVGPWRGEVGFEALYWIPFLDKLKQDGIDPARLIPITRGGAAVWYGVPQGFELYGMRTPQDVRVENRLQHQRTRMLKQTHVTDFDRAVIKDAAKTLGVRRYQTLHPAWMYQTLAPFWGGETGLLNLQRHVHFGGMPLPNLPDGLTLPEKFVAVRFYFRGTFKMSDQNFGFAKACLSRLAQQTPVVIINTGLHTDEHADYAPKDIPNVVRLADLCPMTHENNLAIQTAVIARSLGFVGTYGGMAQLALRYGRPSMTFYDDWSETAIAHKHLSEALSLQMGVPFLVQRIADLPLHQSVCPTAG